jgi:hypothetical protein
MQKLARLGYKFILLSLLILFFFNIFIIKTVNADPEKIMEIVTADEINEEKNFSVSVLDPDLLNIEDIETPYLSDVLIEFNEMSYYIDENLEVTIVAPKVTQDEIFIIKASKEGYIPAYKNITILITQNNKLEIIHDDYVVDASKKFSVQIIDSEGNFVLGAEVYIQNCGEPSSITNERGYATLKAPDNQENFVIIAKKDGYDYATQTFSVNVQPSFWESIIKNQYLPIFIGAILLIFAIIFVTFRQKRLINNRLKEKSDKENLSKYDLNPEVKISSHKNYEINENQYYSRDVVRSQQGKDAKVEEIRIARSSKEKEIIPVESNNIEAEKINNRRKLTKDENEWFEGTDDIRYEIDKLTGKIDENSVDKWFEGYDDIKAKIDEKIKKKDKSKDK